MKKTDQACKSGINKEDKFNWSAQRLIHMECEINNMGLCLKAGDQVVSFKGKIMSTDEDSLLQMEHRIEKKEFVIIHMQLSARQDFQLKKVNWFKGEWLDYDEMVVDSTNLNDNFMFLRKGDISFFISLDFPYSKIRDGSIQYDPHETMTTNKNYECHSITIGACRLSGVMVGKYDRAEIEGVSCYVENRYPLRYNRPVTSTTCITNRMTDVREGRIFYSMYDNPTLFFASDTIKREIELCAELGIEFYQLFEGVFDWPEGEETGKILEDVMKLGREKGVRIGDYVHPGELYCPHYNYEQRMLDKPGWRRKNKDGSSGQLCFGNADFLEYITNTLVVHNKKYGEEMICMDMLDIQPCYDTGHGHEEGDLYRQVLGVVKLMEALSDLSPNYLVWTNSGNFIEFMPKLLWANPNVYLSDPHARDYSTTLNMLKFMGDCRREQMVTVHNKYFVPYVFYTNCEYYFSRYSRVNDLQFFEYSFLQGLCVTPNICLGELRTFLERIPHSKYDYCVDFMKKWINFLKENYDVWKNTYQIGGIPGTGNNEIYAHISKNTGYICFVNQDSYSKKSAINLDNSIGLGCGEKFEIHEIYPRECLASEQPLPYAKYGDNLVFDVPSYSVRIIKVSPYAQSENNLRIYGLPSQVKKTRNGYSILMKAPQGESVELGLVLPVGEKVESVIANPVKTVTMYTFPTEAKILDISGNTARMVVKFPRDKVVNEINEWVIDNDHKKVDFSALEGCPFIGARIHNLFTEDYQVNLEVVTSTTDEHGYLENKKELSKPENILLKGKKHSFETSFYLPFIEWTAFAMPFGDDEVIEIVFRDPKCVSNIAASINGKPVNVSRYQFPTSPDMFTYYIELTGILSSGLTVLLRLDVEWTEELGKNNLISDNSDIIKQEGEEEIEKKSFYSK